MMTVGWKPPSSVFFLSSFFLSFARSLLFVGRSKSSFGFLMKCCHLTAHLDGPRCASVQRPSPRRRSVARFASRASPRTKHGSRAQSSLVARHRAGHWRPRRPNNSPKAHSLPHSKNEREKERERENETSFSLSSIPTKAAFSSVSYASSSHVTAAV